MFPKLRLTALVLTLVLPLPALKPAAALAAGPASVMLRAALGIDVARVAEAQAGSAAGLPAAGAQIARFAHRLLGIPYVWGGDSPRDGFDCSGLVRYVYAHFGIRLPHSSYADFDLGVRVARGALSPGDLVFFDDLGHVGIYVGDGRFIQAPHSGSRVQITSLAAAWYDTAYDGARRLIGRAGQPLMSA